MIDVNMVSIVRTNSTTQMTAASTSHARKRMMGPANVCEKTTPSGVLISNVFVRVIGWLLPRPEDQCPKGRECRRALRLKTSVQRAKGKERAGRVQCIQR